MSEETPAPQFNTAAAIKASVRYWEHARLIYLLLLCPASAAGYFAGEFIAALTFGDEAFLSNWEIFTKFFVGFMKANVAFSCAYFLEYAFTRSSRYDSYVKTGRTGWFASGCVLGMIFAFGASRAIAFAKYSPL